MHTSRSLCEFSDAREFGRMGCALIRSHSAFAHMNDTLSDLHVPLVRDAFHTVL